MVTMSSASAVSIVSEEGSEQPTELNGSSEPKPDPEPSENPEPPPPSPETPAASSDPPEPPAEETESSDTGSKEEPGAGTNEPASIESTDLTSSAPSGDAATDTSLTSSTALAAPAEPFTIGIVVVGVGSILFTLTTQVSAPVVEVHELSSPEFLDLLALSFAFRLFGPDDETCSGPFTEDIVDFDGVTATSGDFTPTEPGTFRFKGALRIGYGGGNFEIDHGCNQPNESVLVREPSDPDEDGADDEDSEDDEDSDGKKSHGAADDQAALPNTGASTNLNLIGGTGIALTILGMFMVVATPRRRAAAHRA